MAKKKNEDRNDIIKDIQEKFKGQNIKIGFMSEDESLGKIERFSTGNVALDVLTDGGLIKGRVNEIYGAEGCGKSTLLLDIIAHNQKLNDSFISAIINNEKTLDREYALSKKIDLSRLMCIEPETLEQSGDLCNLISKSDAGVHLVGFDTIQAIAPEAELTDSKGKDKSVGDKTIALLGRVYSQFFRMYTSRSIGEMTLILLSQVRTDLSLAHMGIALQRPTGGNAIKHYNMFCIELSRKSWDKSPAKCPPKSFLVKMKLIKCKVLSRYEGNSIIAYFYKGSFDRKMNIIGIARDLKIIKKDKIKIDEYEDTFEDLEDLYNKIPEETVNKLEKMLRSEYTNQITIFEGEENGQES